jgi:hypothetical protein
MIDLLYEFCLRCDKAKVVPAEKEIDAFLMSIDKWELREEFIKFCFYNWENRYEFLDNNI